MDLAASSAACGISRAQLGGLEVDPTRQTRDELCGLGHWTWGFFCMHLAGSALGVILLTVTLFLTYGGRIS